MSQQCSLALSGRLVLAGLSLLAAVALPSCGGGGGDDSPPTVRPKTLTELVITLNNGPRLEFLPAALASRALLDGDTETGTFTYLLNADQIQQYPNFEGSDSDCRWPDELIDMTYEYTAINENAAVLTLYATAVNDLNFTGGFNANNGSFCYFWESGSDGIPVFEVQFDLTFTGDGNTITLNTVTARIPGSLTPFWDIVYIPGEIELSNGDLVPENYNPDVDPNAPSKIAQPTLHNININFTNGIPDPVFDFTGQFVATTVTPPESKTDPLDPDESGLVTLRVNLGGPIIGAGMYTYRRINGSDDAVLEISGSGTTYDGTFTLAYNGRDNGDYIGTADGGTPDPAEVSGTFFIPDAPNF